MKQGILVLHVKMFWYILCRPKKRVCDGKFCTPGTKDHLMFNEYMTVVINRETYVMPDFKAEDASHGFRP